jgi:uncharacterized Tic20 family protein
MALLLFFFYLFSYFAEHFLFSLSYTFKIYLTYLCFGLILGIMHIWMLLKLNENNNLTYLGHNRLKHWSHLSVCVWVYFLLIKKCCQCWRKGLAPEIVESIGNAIAFFHNESNMLLSYASFTTMDVFLILRWTLPLPPLRNYKRRPWCDAVLSFP